ncbi:MAG: cupin domain-containing protein [Alphaproteobacteria bacterium]|nr:cupin domain-containing protein [Alphaproteobacteria bacterium]
MSQAEAETQDPRIDALHRRMAEHSLGGHWQPRRRNPSPKLVPHLWPWSIVYECLMESGEVIKLGRIDEPAKRRTVNLVNPAITDFKSTSRTLQMSVQLVKPGEMAECHRHTAAALRFVVEGEGAGYTNVEGERMIMEPGDLVLTPHWTWHDHKNPGEKNLVWLDVLDVHLINHLDANIHENYSDSEISDNYFDGAAQTVVHEDGYCRRRFGVLRPASAHVDSRFLPYTYKWRDTLAALEAMAAAGESDPYDGILLDYTNPLTGGPTMPTIGCRAQLLAPGESTKAHRHMSSTIYHVVEGAGVTNVGSEKSGGEDLAWGTRDCFFVPSQAWHSFTNASKSERAILFSVSDRPVLESLGLYREEQA